MADEEDYQEEGQLDSGVETAIEAAINERASRLDGMLRSGGNIDALKVALSDPPFASKNLELKVCFCFCLFFFKKDLDFLSFLSSFRFFCSTVLFFFSTTTNLNILYNLYISFFFFLTKEKK